MSALRILVVEDNVDAARTMQLAFELERHQVRLAFSGEQALAQVEHWQPEVAFVDLGLPSIDGYELARQLRRTRPEIELIAVSGYTQPRHVEEATRAGFSKHLPKPVFVPDLLQVARELAKT